MSTTTPSTLITLQSQSASPQFGVATSCSRWPPLLFCLNLLMSCIWMINVAPVHVVLRELKPQNKWSLSQLSGGGSFAVWVINRLNVCHSPVITRHLSLLEWYSSPSGQPLHDGCNLKFLYLLFVNSFHTECIQSKLQSRCRCYTIKIYQANFR